MIDVPVRTSIRPRHSMKDHSRIPTNRITTSLNWFGSTEYVGGASGGNSVELVNHSVGGGGTKQAD